MNLIQRTRRLLCIGLAFFMVAMVVVVPPASAAGGLQVEGLEPITYEEGGPPVPVAPNVVVSGGGTFADGFIEFKVTGGNTDDRLFLPEGSTPNPDDGAITVIGSAVYLGLGNGDFKQIGTIHSMNDGREGRPLRVDFSAALPNADFSGGVDANGHPIGWTINGERVILPASLATKTQGRPLQNYTTAAGSYTVNHADYSFQSDRAFGANAGTNGHRYEGFQHPLSTYDAANYTGTVEGGALHLRSKGTNCANPGYTEPFCSVFGPDAWSSPFDAKAGDDLAFDWKAAKIDDDYEVYGFLVDVDTNEHYELMYGRGASRDWSTSAGVIPADGTYKFRFVSGTFDYTGGLLVGASLYIDNVRVLSSDANNAVAQSVARLVHYENTGQNPPSELTIGVTLESSEGTVESEVETEIELVDDPPVLGTPNPAVFVNTNGPTSFASLLGQFTAVDPEGDPITFGIEGAEPETFNYIGIGFTHSLTTDYAKIHVHDTTGMYLVVPNVTFLNNALTPSSESLVVTATANGLIDTATMTIGVDIELSPPGAPTDLSATSGDQQVTLNWIAPEWIGGDAITGYQIEQQDILSGDWSTVVANTNSTDTTYTFTGLTNGDTHIYRVKAINDTGTGAPSHSASARPMGLPGAPTSAGANVGSETLHVAWNPPGNNGGGEITSYQVEMSTNGGTTWESAGIYTGADRSANLTGLTPGVAVDVRIAAVNAVGAGPWLELTYTPFTSPTVPQNLTATPDNEQVALTWDAPLDNGGRPVTGYQIDRSTDGGNTWIVVVGNTGTDATSYEVTGLTNGETSQFRVSAINLRGVGDPSNVVTSTPRTVADAPAALDAYAGHQTAYLVWETPLSDGGAPVTGYWIEKSIDGGTTWTTVTYDTGNAHQFVYVRDLTNGQLTHFRVSAHNAAGVGSPSPVATATPHTSPSAPINIEATPGNAVVDLTWDAPLSDGGDPVSGYEIYTPGADPLGPWVRVGTVTGGTTTTYRIEGLTNGVPATFTVAAVNSAGPGDVSDEVTATPRTVPTAPLSLAAAPVDEGAVLTWNNPFFDGGAAITGYRIEYSTDGGANWTTATANTGTTDRLYTVDGLTNGQTTQFRVAAINVAGTGAPSTPTSETPRTIAGAPTNVVTTPGHEQVELSWDVPADNGGAAIVGYRIEISTDNGTTWTTVQADTQSTDTNFVVTGLDNGVPAQFRIAALNPAGVGTPAVSESTTPRTTPDGPLGLVADPGDGLVVLTWDEPSNNGGNAVSGYKVEMSGDGGATWTVVTADTGSTDTTFAVTGLENGDLYSFRVTALNEAGAGTESDVVTATPFTVPGAPTITSIKAGNRVVTVTFNAPSFDGGSDILTYEYSYDGGITWHESKSGTTSPIVIGPLNNNTTYPIQIRAKNAAGYGAISNQLPATPITAPVLPGGAGSGSNGGSGGSGGNTGPSVPLTVDGAPREVTVTLPTVASNGSSGSGGSGAGEAGAGRNGDTGVPVVIRYADGDFHVDVAGADQNGAPNTAGPNNELRMTKGGTVTVSGGGFEPGTTVDIWIMGDEPILLGEVTVGPDGTFTVNLAVPESAVLGLTELQVNGVGDDGSVRTLNIAAEVLDATAEPNPVDQAGPPRRPSSPEPSSLAFTGSRVFVWTLLGLVLLIGGVASIVISTNRDRRGEENLNGADALS